MDLQSDVLRQGQQSVGELLQHAQRVVDVCPFGARYRELDVRMGDAALDQFSQSLRIGQIQHPNPATTELVLVRRSYPTTSRSNLFVRRALAVDQLVIRKDQMRAIAHIEPAFNVDAIRNQLVDLSEQSLDIEDDAVADGAANAGMEDAAGDLVQNE